MSTPRLILRLPEDTDPTSGLLKRECVCTAGHCRCGGRCGTRGRGWPPVPGAWTPRRRPVVRPEEQGAA